MYPRGLLHDLYVVYRRLHKARRARRPSPAAGPKARHCDSPPPLEERVRLSNARPSRVANPLSIAGAVVLRGLGEADLSMVKTAYGIIGATREHVLSTRCRDFH